MKVKNPKTTAQTLQRVLVKVVALCYAMLKAICNHSFEGVTNGFQCMNKCAQGATWPDDSRWGHRSQKHT